MSNWFEVYVFARNEHRHVPKIFCIYSVFRSPCNFSFVARSIAGMDGGNWVFFGCPNSGKHKLSLFQIPCDSEHMKQLKQTAHEEWLCLILKCYCNKFFDPFFY
jgi:hypothetical protein